MANHTDVDDLPPMALSGCLSQAEVLTAYRLARKSLKRRLWLGVAIPIVFILVFVAVAVSTRPHSPAASNRILFAVCVFLPAILLFPYFRFRLMLRRLLRQNSDAFYPYATKLDSQGMHLVGDSSEARIAWESFDRYRTADSMCILYWKGSADFEMFGRSRFSDSASWDAFLSFVRTQFVAAGS